MGTPPPGRHLREGGRVRLADGASLLWSMAEGGRGRRWRAVATRDGAITHALLLEVDRAGRPARLELTTPAGMLTLHPEPDERSIHGNVVSAAGVRPLAFAWSSEHELDIVDRPIAMAVGLHRRRGTCPVGATASIPVLVIDASLRAVPGDRTASRLTEDRWIVIDRATGAERTLTIDADGVLVSDERWPLEP